MAYLLTIVFAVCSMTLFLFVAKAIRVWRHGFKWFVIQLIRLIISPHAFLFLLYPFLFERDFPHEWGYNPIVGMIIMAATLVVFVLLFKEDFKSYLYSK